MPRIPAATPTTSIVEICHCLLSLALGRTHNKGTFSISINQATTTVADTRVKVGDVIHVTPLDANAYTKMNAASFYIPTVTAADALANQFTVNHANDATAGTFGYTIWGE